MSSYARRLLLSRWRAVCTRSLSDIRVWCNVLWVVGEAERRRRGIKNTGIGGCGGKKRERELTGKKRDVWGDGDISEFLGRIYERQTPPRR